MRRRTEGCQRVRELLGDGLARLGSLDPEEVIAKLEPLSTDGRRARLGWLLDQRLDSVTVVMDKPHDPFNGAAVARTCDALGVQRLHVVATREPFLLARSVARGSEKWIDVVEHANVRDAVDALREGGFTLVAGDPAGELLPRDLATIPRVAIVVGNEHDGIAAELRAAASRTVRVPMRGFAESLNLGASTAILMSHAVEGRAGDLSHADKRRLYARGLFLSVRSAPAVLGLGPAPRE